MPQRHVVMSILRRAATTLGLKPPVLATLDALLSCLPPQRDHHVVFASNETLVFRRDGVTERTIRRHVAVLLEAGLLERRDSANRKRFIRRSPSEKLCLRFGFDLAPLFGRIAELAGLAAQADALKEQLALLRSRIRHAAQARLRADPADALALAALPALRRNLSLEALEALARALPAPAASPLAEADAEEMSANNGQNVRHHLNSTKELKDKKAESIGAECRAEAETITVTDVVAACPEAVSFAEKPPASPGELVHLGRTLAPMIGVAPTAYQGAESRIGREACAIAVMAIVQMQHRIKSMAGYFCSITIGRNAENFDPGRLLMLASRRPSLG